MARPRRGTLEPVPTHASLQRLALCLALLGFAAIAILSYLWNEDFWWYVGSGRVLLAERGVPAQDPFLYTAPPGTWVFHSWLWSVLVAALVRVGGVQAALAGSAAVAVATLALLWGAARVDRFGWTSTLVALAWFLAAGVGFLQKASAASALLLIVYLRLLESDTAGAAGPVRSWRRWALFAGLQLLWANLHGGYPLGIAVVLAYALGGWLESRRVAGASRSNFPPVWLPVALLAVSLIGPGGLRARLAPFGFVAGSEAVQPVGEQGTLLILEWRSPFQAGGWPLAIFWLAAVVGAASFLVAPRRRWGRGLTFLAFAALAATAIRHLPLFCLVAGFCVLRNLGERAAANRSARRTTSRWAPVPALVFAGLLVVSAGLIHAARHGFDAGESRRQSFTVAPRLAWPEAERVLDDLPGPVFNDLQLGAYLGAHLYTQHRFFVDGRILDPQLVVEYTRMVGSAPAWRRATERWGFRTAVLGLYSKTVRAPLGAALQADPAWRLAHLDPLVAVFRRDAGAPPARPPRGDLAPFDAGSLGRLAPAASLLQRLVLREDPDNYLIEYLAVLGQLGFPRQAEAVASAALRSRPRHPLLLRQRCAARTAFGELGSALEDCELAARLAPDDGGIVALQCLVLARAGRISEARDRLAEGLRRLPNDPELRRVERQLQR